jgi:hypothetical protein
MAKKRINFRPDHAEQPGLPALVTPVRSFEFRNIVRQVLRMRFTDGVSDELLAERMSCEDIVRLLIDHAPPAGADATPN